MRISRPSQRPERFRLDPRNSLWNGLVFAGLGQHAGSTYYHDDGPYSNSGALQGYTGDGNLPSDQWSYSDYLGRTCLGLKPSSSDYVSVPDSPSLAFGTGDFTLSIWGYERYYLSAGYAPALFGKAAGSGSYAGFGLKWNDGQYNNSGAQFWPYNAGGDYANSPNVSCVALVWYHYAVRRLGGKITAWIDGVPGAEVANAVDVTNSMPLRIGWRSDGWTGGYWEGALADAMIWGRGLGADEIGAIADPADWSLGGLVTPERRIWAVQWPSTSLLSSTTAISGSSSLLTGQQGSWSATVSGSGTTPTGTVQWQIDGTNSGSPVALNGSGIATLSHTWSDTTGSPHTLTAIYSGDSNYDGSTSSGKSVTVTAAGTVITSYQTGDWSNTATWTGGTIPGNGDIVVIQEGHTVTLDANAGTAGHVTIGDDVGYSGGGACLIVVAGTSCGTNTGARLIIDSGCTLTCRGSIELLGGYTHDFTGWGRSQTACLTLNAGATLEFAPAAGQWNTLWLGRPHGGGSLYRNNYDRTAWLECLGTANSRCAVRKAPGSSGACCFWNQRGGDDNGDEPGVVIKAQYCDFTDMGGPQCAAIYVDSGGYGNPDENGHSLPSANTLVLENCTFTRCFRLQFGQKGDVHLAPAGLGDLIITDCTWVGSPSPYDGYGDPNTDPSHTWRDPGGGMCLSIDQGLTTYREGKTYTIARNDFDGILSFTNSAGSVFQDNILRVGMRSDGWGPGTWTGNFFYVTNAWLTGAAANIAFMSGTSHESSYYDLDLSRLYHYRSPAISGLTLDGTDATHQTVKPTFSDGHEITTSDLSHSVIFKNGATEVTRIKITGLTWNETQRKWEGWKLLSDASAALAGSDNWTLNEPNPAARDAEHWDVYDPVWPIRCSDGTGKFRWNVGGPVHDCVFEFQHTDVTPPGPTIEIVYGTDMKNCCVIGTADYGWAPGGAQLSGGANMLSTIEHNTMIAADFYYCYIMAETTSTHSTYRSNIFFGKPWQFLTGQNTNTGYPAGPDLILSSDVCANVFKDGLEVGISNKLSGDPGFTNPLPMGCQGCWFTDSGPAGLTNPMNTTISPTTNTHIDPQLVDPEVSFAKWGRHVGYSALQPYAPAGVTLGAGTADYIIADAALDYISATDRTLTRTTVIPWIKSQLAPRNPALLNMAHDFASPTTAAGSWPGAVVGAASGSGSSSNTGTGTEEMFNIVFA